MVLDSQKHLRRQLRFQSQLEKRRRYRSWAQAFQLGALFVFADQIVRTYCAGQVAADEQHWIFGMSFLRLVRIPDESAIELVQRLLSPQWQELPHYLTLALWLAFSGLLLSRMRHARFGELVAFALVLAGGFSNLLSLRFTTHQFDALLLQVGKDYVTFNLADLFMIIGSYFILRGYLLRLRLGWLKFSRI